MPQSLMEDARYLLGRISFLDGQELKGLCRDLGLPVTNMGSGDMAEQIRDKIIVALSSHNKMPSRDSVRTLSLFRYYILVKSKFLERYLDRVKRYVPD